MASNDDVYPHSLEAERGVLGGILIDNAQFAVASAKVRAPMFYRAGHGLVWQTIEAVIRRGQGADLLTVSTSLAHRGVLDDAGGPAYIASLVDGVPFSTNVEYYAAQVREFALLRALATLSERVRSSALAHGADSARVVADTLSRFNALTARAFSSSWSAGQEQAEAYDALLARSDEGRIPMGLYSLDRQLSGGIGPGEVAMLMGRPGLGKTLILSQLMTNVLDSTTSGAAMFSLEMPTAQIVERMARMSLNVTKDTLRGQWATHRADYIERIRSRVLITDASGLSISDMGARIAHARSSHLRDVANIVVVIDHLGLVGGDTNLATYERVSKQVREIKELAKTYSVAVVVAVQVSREAGGDGSRRLTLGAARDSGVIEEVGDYIFGLRRLDRCAAMSADDRAQYRNLLFLEMLKNRHGEVTFEEVVYGIDPISLLLSQREDVVAPAREPNLSAAMGGRGR